MANNSTSAHSSEAESYDDDEHNFTRLTNLVRSQYFVYLKKVVDQNYMEWLKGHNSYSGKNIAPEKLDECAVLLEERAIKKCMVVQLYRKAILRIIARIRRETLHGRLISKLNENSNPIKREPASDLSVITEKALPKMKSNKNDRCFGGSYTPPRPIDIQVTDYRQLSTDDQNFSNNETRQDIGFKKTQSGRAALTEQSSDPQSAIVLHEATGDCYQDSASILNEYSHDRNIDNSNLKYVHHAELQFDENYEIPCFGNNNLAVQPVPFVRANFNENGEERNPYLLTESISSQKEPNLSLSNKHLHKFESAGPDEDNQQNEPICSNDSLDNEPTEITPSDASSGEKRYVFLSLQEKIQHFQEILDKKENKRIAHKRKRSPLPIIDQKNHRKLSIAPPPSPVSTSSEEEPNLPERTSISDSIDKDLQNLFGEDGKNESDDIFGDGSYNPHIDFILREIENSELPDCADISNKSQTNNESKAKEKKTKSYKLKPLITDMRDSLWPCEHYKWKQTLRETLGQMAEVDIRLHEQIRLRFRELFGEDSEDEFEPYSPTLELDDILISSCMKRIAPTIVKYLMSPMNNGLIANRVLFKKLAKKLAYNIVMENQYADEVYIKERVDLVFLFKRRIQSIADLDNT